MLKIQPQFNDPNNVKTVIDYLECHNVKRLNFVVMTHAHKDHIGGVPAIAEKFVDGKTEVYYRKYRLTKEDKVHPGWYHKEY